MLAYQTAVAELYHLGHELHKTASYKFDLKHMRVLAEALGSPQTRFPSVLIAGTNGKGSTAATLASILQTAGYRTGLYTSPHLVRINERIRIDGEPISDAEFAAGYECVHAVAAELVAGGRLPAHPSFFEMMTAIAFRHFAGQRVAVVVAEVGMGGRLDATNILEPLVSVITDIDLDHQKFLGNTVGEIAAEKAGIMRRGRPLVTLPQHPEANQTLGRAMEESGAVAVSAAQYVPAVSPAATSWCTSGQRAPASPWTSWAKRSRSKLLFWVGTSCATWRWRFPPPRNWRSRALGFPGDRLPRAFGGRAGRDVSRLWRPSSHPSKSKADLPGTPRLGGRRW